VTGRTKPDPAVRRDAAVPWRIFVGIAVFMALIAVLYWLVSYEDAGTVMLALSCGLALLVGGWLFLQDHHRRRGPAEPPPQVQVDAAAGTVGDSGAATTTSGAAATSGATATSRVVGRAAEVETEGAAYLPEASVWPFGIGLGALAMLNGLIVGWAYAVPGAMLLLLAVAGFISQGRRRDPG
jgi:hypothetical protein